MVDGARWNAVYFLATFLALFVTLLLLTNGEAFDYPSIVTPPVSWTNVVPTDFSYWESAGVRPILLNGSFVCGFHCQFEGTACVFAISIFPSSVGGSSSFSPQMVWSANRNNPIGLWAKLQLSEEGDLILQDVHSTAVWSTRTAGKSVSGLKLTHQGNLVLFDRNGDTVWQSFHHPTDSLVVGQRLVSGQRLVASMSVTNWSEGLYSFLIDDSGYFVAYAELYTTLLYYHAVGSELKDKTGQFYAELNYGSFGGFHLSSGVNFIQFGSDGHLRSFRWVESDWEKSYDLFHDQLYDPCDYPLACGEYGFCSEEGECKCLDPDENGKAYFKPINSSRSDLGCSPYVPISCKSPYHESLLEIKNASYPVLFLPPYSNITDIESCKQACLNNCSCKFAIFQSYSFNSSGQCSFGSEALSFKRLNEDNIAYYNVYYNGGNAYFNLSWFSNSSAFLKVQRSPIVVQSSPIAPIPRSPQRKKRQNIGVILGSTLGASFSVLLCILFFLQIKKDPNDVEEDYLGHILGTPTRFSYEELKVATNNFSNKLGEGGFGCVFQGTLPGGAQIAVKCLDGFGPIKKTFIAEVETIGSIHHFNLVRLVGFCAEKFRMLLVYEYMCNGSLDQWIFCRDKALALGWQCRRKIIVDIAKGLAYLHEECRQKIIHLDIKPQNILLDENLNAKVSDFGLSKLVGREQSQIVTTMRGTPGYMAPEWLNSVITEKVDVYSFGIVVLEILCGRKNVDRTQSEEDAHLVSLFKRKVEDGRLLDLLDKYNDEMQSNAAEVVEMMKVAAWCLQGEYAKRPSMSIVVKFLEGKMDNENEYGFSNPPAPAQVEILGHQMDAGAAAASSIIPSILSGPR